MGNEIKQELEDDMAHITITDRRIIARVQILADKYGGTPEAVAAILIDRGYSGSAEILAYLMDRKRTVPDVWDRYLEDG